MFNSAKSSQLVPLLLNDWRATRDSLHDYALVLGTIRGLFAPPEPHWAHVSLRVTHDGLTTTPIPISAGHCEIRLNFRSRQLEFSHLQGMTTTLALTGQSQTLIANWLLDQLRPLQPVIDEQKLPDWQATVRPWDPAASARFGQILTEISSAFELTRLHLPGRTSELQFWPHHFDLAFLWFSGRKIPGQEPTDLDNSDEQINLGFMTGDDSINEAYFYATVYPEPAGLADQAWPQPGRWFQTGWRGVVADYAAFAKQKEGAAALRSWFTQTHQLLRAAIIQQS
jgi:hypothetical protein